MKNQNDLIVAGAVVLVCIGVILGFYFTKRDPVAPPNPTPVVITDAEPAAATVTYANSLPGGGGGTGGGGAPSGAGRGAGLGPAAPGSMGIAPE
ncbi:MAG: hypothetical protein WD716_02735 [Fimbriimonadaceae bacterium]